MIFNRSNWLRLAGACIGLAGWGVAQAGSSIHWSVGVSPAPGISVGIGNVHPQVIVPRPIYGAPVYVQPAPVYVQPAPVYVRPAPVFVRPAPVFVRPPPMYVQPAPVYVQPAPVYSQPPVIYGPPPVIYAPPGYHGHFGWPHRR